MNDAPVYREEYYADAPLTTRLAPALATIERARVASVVSGFLIAFACFALGWFLRSAFPNDYTALAWLVPLVTFYVAWGNRRKDRSLK